MGVVDYESLIFFSPKDSGMYVCTRYYLRHSSGIPDLRICSSALAWILHGGFLASTNRVWPKERMTGPVYCEQWLG